MADQQADEAIKEEQIRHVAQLIFDANDVVVFTGAGASAESGISTFRDPEIGVWKNKIGLALFGTPFGWKFIPYWSWTCYIRYFRQRIAAAKPNKGHYAIADLERFCSDPESFGEPNPDLKPSIGRLMSKKKFAIITQNVDGLHQKAGNSDSKVFEVHGTVNRHRCIRHGHINENLSDEVLHSTSSPPKCATCGGYLRPDATLFTESLPEDTWMQAHSTVSSLGKNSKGVMLIVGTSGVVYPAASLPRIAAESGNDVHIVEINPEPSTFSNTQLIDTFICGTGGDILAQIVQHIRKLQAEKSKSQAKQTADAQHEEENATLEQDPSSSSD